VEFNNKSLNDQIFQGKVWSFSYYSSPENDLEPSIDLTLINGQEIRIFRIFSTKPDRN